MSLCSEPSAGSIAKDTSTLEILLGVRSALSLALTNPWYATTAASARGSGPGAGDEPGTTPVDDLEVVAGLVVGVVDEPDGGELDGSDLLDEVQAVPNAKTADKIKTANTDRRVTSPPTPRLQGSASSDPESQCAHFAP